MKEFLSTKEVAGFLGINEKMVYTLISDKGMPASKVTGKWLFPKHLVEQWLEINTINFPEPTTQELSDSKLLIITGSNDLLLERTLSLFNSLYPGFLVVFGNLGSMGGLKALMENRCHMATSHLLQEDKQEYNLGFSTKLAERSQALINFCKREQGILIPKGNPNKINSIADLTKAGIKMINRPLGTGTRRLLDIELKNAGIRGEEIEGYQNEVHKHLDVGLEILSGRANTGIAIRAVASMLNLDFIPIRWERYDLLISKDNFFNEGVQLFKELLHEKAFKDLAANFDGYDLSLSGKMLFANK